MQGKIEGDLKVYESLSSVAKSGSTSKVLDTPSQVNATQNEFNSKIIVSWNDVDNREYFIVERCIADMTTLSADYVPDESEFSVICEYTNDLSYVDDIFLILSSLGDARDLKSYYKELVDLFSKYGLTLQSEGSDKCKLIDKYSSSVGGLVVEDLAYLGYHLYLKKKWNHPTKIVVQQKI